MLPAMLPSVPPTPAMTWTPVERVLGPAVVDGKPETYELLRPTGAQDPADFGFAWQTPERVGTVRAVFASLGGRSFEPDPRGSIVQVWRSGRWHAVRADLDIDTSRVGEIAPLQQRGSVEWTFRFRPVETMRVRVYASAPAHRDLNYQQIALTDLAVAPEGAEAPSGRIARRGPDLEPPACLDVGANLAVPQAGARTVPGKPWTVTWYRPMMVDTARTAATAGLFGAEWFTGRDWRPVERAHVVEPGVLRFTPVCAHGLRLLTERAVRAAQVSCGAAAADYFEAVRLCRTDMLGERFRSLPRRDLAAMNGLLHPIDFAKTAIGRPADAVETMVTWSGAFLQMTTGAGEDPNTGAALPQQAMERWFAPALNGRLPDWFHTRSSYLDGWLPATVTEFEADGVRATQTVFVTPPGAPVYATVAIITLSNTTRRARTVDFSLAMGFRRIYGDPPTPFVSDPLVTGYRMDPDGRTVRAKGGSVVAHALQPMTFGGTQREPRLDASRTLGAGKSAMLAFIVPDVTEPLTDAAKLASLEPSKLLAEFRTYWNDLMGRGATVDIPEPGLGDAVRNLIAQAMIVGLDGDVARYGAYHYESYFGLEEGWPAVALAQFGHAHYGRRIMDYMLSPSCLDKANYHHQYRNGLAPWYAADIARLEPDRAWLEKIAPTLRACADWTVAQIEGNKDPKWGGILPRHAYGGDIGMPAYSFYSNATCLRGLHDTALVLRMLGDEPNAARYAVAAERYRARLVELADSLVDRTSGLPFLPMSFGLGDGANAREKEPAYAVLACDVPYSDTWTYLGNYWNLFAPCFQELRAFPVADERSQWVPRYMEQRGGILAGQVRFANGLDAVYGKGYIQSLLDHGQREEYVTSLFGLFSAAMSRNLFSNPEVSGVFQMRTSNLGIYREHMRERWFWSYRYGGAWAQGWQNQEGEPLAAGAGMALQLLRAALVREDYAEDPPDTLLLLDGAPAHWFEAGQVIRADRMRTFFGTVSFTVESSADGATAQIMLPSGFSARQIIVRLPSPDGRPVASALVNGLPAATTDATIRIDAREGTTTVAVRW